MNSFFNKFRQYISHPRYKKILKKVVFFIIGIVGFVLISSIGLKIYFTQNKEMIVSKINQKINENILGHVSIGDVEYKFLVGFPNFTIVLNKVELRDSQYAIHKRSLLKAAEIEVRLNVFGLLNKDLDIRKILLIDSKIDFFTDKNGISNSNILKPKPKTNQTKTKTDTEIAEVDFKNVVVISQNFQRNKLFHFEVNSLNCKIKHNNEGWNTNIFLDVFAKNMAFNTVKGSFIKDKRVQGKLAVVYNTFKNRIDVATKKLEIGSDSFDINANFILDKEHPMMDINISTTILWANATQLLDPHIFKILNHFNITKPIAANCTLKGDMNAEGDPEIVVVAKINNNELITPDGSVTNCSFIGKYTNNFKQGLGFNDANSAVILTRFSGNYKEIPVIIPQGMITNFDKPIGSGSFTSSFDVAKMKNIFGTDLIKFYDGKANVNLKFKANIVDLKIEKPVFSGTVAIEKAHLLYKPKNLTFNTDIQFDFTENALLIKKIKYQNDKNIIFIDGKIDNFLNLYYNDPAKMVAALNINCEYLDAKKFLKVLAYKEKKTVKNKPRNAEKTKDNQSLLSKIQVILNLKIQNMNYASLSAKNAKFTISINNSQLFIKNGWIETAKGNVALNAQLIPNKSGYDVASNVKINTVDIPQFLTSFNNFGIKSFNPDNILGNLSATADLKGKITAEGDLIDESVQGNLRYTIKNGSLINFEPIVKVGRFVFPNRDMKNIVFNNLSGKLKMTGSFVNVDFFKVSSNVLNFDVMGIYSFKKGTNLGLTVPLRDPKDDINIKDKTEREAQRQKGIVLHLLVVDGPDDQMKIKLGRLPEQK